MDARAAAYHGASVRRVPLPVNRERGSLTSATTLARSTWAEIRAFARVAVGGNTVVATVHRKSGRRKTPTFDEQRGDHGDDEDEREVERHRPARGLRPSHVADVARRGGRGD